MYRLSKQINLPSALFIWFISHIRPLKYKLIMDRSPLLPSNGLLIRRGFFLNQQLFHISFAKMFLFTG